MNLNSVRSIKSRPDSRDSVCSNRSNFQSSDISSIEDDIKSTKLSFGISRLLSVSKPITISIIQLIKKYKFHLSLYFFQNLNNNILFD